jgi:hypothetical protein
MKEIVCYAVVDGGNFITACASEKQAQDVLTSIEYVKGCTIVKLTGQMPEPKKMKKVASYLYMNDIANVFQANQLVTEDAAKQECAKYNVELIKWPYGSVIEVEE